MINIGGMHTGAPLTLASGPTKLPPRRSTSILNFGTKLECPVGWCQGGSLAGSRSQDCRINIETPCLTAMDMVKCSRGVTIQSFAFSLSKPSTYFYLPPRPEGPISSTLAPPRPRSFISPATQPIMSAPPNVLLFATGSVATIKLQPLVTSLLQHRLNLRVIVSPSAERFLSAIDLALLTSVVTVYRNEDEWAQPWTRGDPVLHIELRKWADLLLIAPLSANSLARMAGGLCDGLGLSVVRAWDTTATVAAPEGGVARRKMILVAPAMNTQMYLHPLTEEHLTKLRSWAWIRVLPPVEKLLACGDLGVGGMMEVANIVGNVVGELGLDIP